MKFAKATVLPLLFLLSSIVSLSQTQSAPSAAEAVQVTGLTGIKENTKGTLTVENGTLTFATSKSSCDVSAASIQDVVTGNDSQRVIRGTVGTLTMLAPYGGGREISLLRTKIDTITIQYVRSRCGCCLAHGFEVGGAVGSHCFDGEKDDSTLQRQTCRLQ